MPSPFPSNALRIVFHLVQFSFLVSVPLILGAAAVDAKHLLACDAIGAGPLIAGFFTAFIFGLLSLWGLLRIVKSGRLWLFSIYLFPLGMSILIYGFIKNS